MYKPYMGALCILFTCAAVAASDSAPTQSGLDKQYNGTERAQDDIFRAVNGKWLDTVAIPADRSRWGGFVILREETQNQLKDVIDADIAAGDTASADQRRVADLYKSFMDEDTVQRLGVQPLDAELKRIRALHDRQQIPALLAHLNEIGCDTPLSVDVHQDNRDATRYVVQIDQGGLGLPDRDYYLKLDDKHFAEVRAKYLVHIARLFNFAGIDDASDAAKHILALETGIAQAQWERAMLRDPVKAYNKYPLKQLSTLAPDLDWASFDAKSGYAGKVGYVIVGQPSYVKSVDKLLRGTPLGQLKQYFSWLVVSEYAPYLSKPFVDERFAFTGTLLRDTPENLPRWKRAVALVDGGIGEDLGQGYVAKYFPPDRRARMEAMVGNLIRAYRESIRTLDWMGPETKQAAQGKLDQLMLKIGYPKKWRDYSKLVIKPDDLVGNVMRANVFEYQRNINKLGKPIDRDEWGMTPQTVNAYYNPELNEIVFPAAILQPPFFNYEADDAVNYGAIGTVIGHEISHGFDDQGSQYDAAGNLHDWWTKEDHARFKEKTAALITQYDAYEPVPGYHINGALTLGENIADNSGLAITYKAYELSLRGKPSSVIDGLTGEQRLYEGFAQAFREKVREAQAIVYLKTDPHSPSRFRVFGSVRNQPGFYEAFGVKPGDGEYLPPEQRVLMW